MFRDNRMFLSLSIAGALSAQRCAAYRRITLMGKTICTFPVCVTGLTLRTIPLPACFLSCRPSFRRTIPYGNRPRSWVKKVALSTRWVLDRSHSVDHESRGVQSEQSRQSQHDGWRARRSVSQHTVSSMLVGYAGVRGRVVPFLEPMDSFAYCILSHTIIFRERTPQMSFLSFHLEKEAMDYALSVVQFLPVPGMHLVHAGKQ